jgi:hypothetical protein
MACGVKQPAAINRTGVAVYNRTFKIVPLTKFNENVTLKNFSGQFAASSG